MRAFVPLVRVVGLQVPHLGGGVGEGLVAEVAVVRLLAAVHQVVALHVARRGEELPAHAAAVARLSRVPLAVQVEQADLPVALPTRGAAVWLQRAAGGRQNLTCIKCVVCEAPLHGFITSTIILS